MKMVFKLTDKDKRVIRAFLKKMPLESKKLTSTGYSLEGSWLGGSNIAVWRDDGSLYIAPISSKSRETIDNYIRKVK